MYLSCDTKKFHDNESTHILHNFWTSTHTGEASPSPLAAPLSVHPTYFDLVSRDHQHKIFKHWVIGYRPTASQRQKGPHIAPKNEEGTTTMASHFPLETNLLAADTWNYDVGPTPPTTMPRHDVSSPSGRWAKLLHIDWHPYGSLRPYYRLASTDDRDWAQTHVHYESQCAVSY